MKNEDISNDSEKKLASLYEKLSKDPNIKPISFDHEVIVKAPYLRDSRDVGH